MKTTMITEEQKQELQNKGYYIEDMQQANGSGWWNGLYRFMNKKTEDFGNPQPNEDEAWADASQYDLELQQYYQKRGNKA